MPDAPSDDAAARDANADSADHVDDRAGLAGLRAYHLLALVPVLAMLGGIPFANRTEPYVLGLPFLLFWILAWVVGTSAVLALIYVLDRRRAARGEPLP